MLCHTLLPGENLQAPLIEWRTDLHERPPEGDFPWVLTLRGDVDPKPYLARGPSYVQIELADLEKYSFTIPTILSLHLDELTSLDPIDELMSHRADLYKIAAHIPDPLLLMRFIKRVQKEPKLIGIAMGESGELTRALSPKLNNPITFCGNAAPGQLSADILQERFRHSSQSAMTQVIGLLGYPLHLSPGVRYHNARFAKRGLDICYVNIPLRENLAGFLEEVPRDFIGFSVTMPLKKEAAAFAIDGSPAINTLKRQGSKWVGINTDGPAMRFSLEKRGSIRSKKIAILGTGGLAHSAQHAVGGELIPRKNLPAFDPEPYDIIIQATSCGMQSEEMPIATPQGKIVLEGINRVTPFHTASLQAGCEVISGWELFETQANLQQEFWLESPTS